MKNSTAIVLLVIFLILFLCLSICCCCGILSYMAAQNDDSGFTNDVVLDEPYLEDDYKYEESRGDMNEPEILDQNFKSRDLKRKQIIDSAYNSSILNFQSTGEYPDEILLYKDMLMIDNGYNSLTKIQLNDFLQPSYISTPFSTAYCYESTVNNLEFKLGVLLEDETFYNKGTTRCSRDDIVTNHINEFSKTSK